MYVTPIPTSWLTGVFIMSLTGDLLDTIDCSDDAYSKPGSPLAQTLLERRVYWGNNRTVSVISESKRRKFNLILVVRACNLVGICMNVSYRNKPEWDDRLKG